MFITGFHSIEEKVRSQKKNQAAGGAGKAEGSAYKIYFSKPGPRVKKILAAAKEAGITCEQTDDKKLDSLVAGLDESLRDHRGIVMELAGSGKQPAANLVDFDSWVKTHSGDLAGNVVGAGEAGEADEDGNGKSSAARCTVVILDSITDPHNVGAIIRSCDQFGASLVVIPEHNSASDIAGNEVIGRTSAGASAWVPVAVVNNLVRATEQLKQAGFWVYGADAGGQNCRTIDFAAKSALIMGSEGSGIAPLLEKQCDTIVSIPTCGKIDSLNVSVAAGVLLYEISK